MSLEEATLYRRRFFETYPGLRRWHDNERRARQRDDTKTRTLTGRRRDRCGLLNQSAPAATYEEGNSRSTNHV
jgi:DNA polymerase I-like protein with 3'-5' exonuclease and polymerase domains